MSVSFEHKYNIFKLYPSSIITGWESLFGITNNNCENLKWEIEFIRYSLNFIRRKEKTWIIAKTEAIFEEGIEEENILKKTNRGKKEKSII